MALGITALQKWLNPKRLAIIEACLIGLVAGLAAVVLKIGIGWLGGWRVHIAQEIPAWIALPLIGLTGGFLSGFLIEKFATEASGSGIPQVKAALGYIPVALNFRVAVVKLASTILSLGSGLALGRQGPTVQIGAAIAGQVSQWIPNSPEYQRQLIAAGAAAGLAAGFNAPIAGVLFVIEELLHDVSSLTLGTAILASFIGGVVSRILTGQGLSQSIPQVQFSAQEIPFLLLLGLLVGWFAALFNNSVINVTKWNRQTFRMGLSWRIAIAGCLSGIAIAMLPMDFRDSSGLQLFLAMGQSDWQITAGAFVVRFILTLIACSAETPGGLFVPSLILGAALGSLVGNLEHSFLGIGTLATYSLSGMGAFFGAVAKVPITAFVIVFEITMDFNIILPLMITSVVAYLCAEKYAPNSLYTRLLELKGIYLQTEIVTEGLWDGMRALDVMQRQVEALPEQMTIDEAIQFFGRSRHRGFPVVADDELVGIITQMDLGKVQERKLSGDMEISQIMTTKPITVSPEESLSQVLYLLSYYKLSRLPVIDRHKLVGIITRSDILRAQAKRLRGVSSKTTKPSYLVYQRRGTATGKGRLLLPLANPQTAPYLIEIGLAIAVARNYELECLHIITLAPHLSLSETPVDLNPSLELFQTATVAAELKQVSLHTQIRVAHDISQAILEVAGDRDNNLLLIGWHGKSVSPERILEDIVDTVVQQASCDVMLVKFSDRLQKFNPFKQEFKKPNISFNRWLIPIAGSSNTENALLLMPALINLAPYPEIYLCQVFSPNDKDYESSQMEKYAESLYKSLRFSVGQIAVCAKSTADAIVDLANQQRSDVIMLGASHENFFQQMLHGNIPEAIARNSDRTIIIFRKKL
ncbi:chloride channel protein [Pseudanabaena yagii]|uniref:CBS domain-containing protein n=1 Tax=Pseudanabaena yagii GIHE-NHR1 TaxID=2722753 RepID=A0ABX1LXA7_9CYAN|nr:chloride channel protein [Pseudanabaena yagii]NMF60111.1 CBS domain-containing protein [Pseudanabaena yagii GIHE-NHR1]